MSTTTVPAYYLSARFNPRTVVHVPDIAKRKDLSAYSGKLAYGDSVTAYIKTTNGNMHTDDPTERLSAPISTDTTDRGIILKGELEHVPLTFVDPKKVMTIYVIYTFDSTYKLFEGRHSYTFSQMGAPEGSRIEISLEGRDICVLEPTFRMLPPVLGFSKRIEPYEEPEVQTSIVDSVYQSVSNTASASRRALQGVAQDSCVIS